MKKHEESHMKKMHHNHISRIEVKEKTKKQPEI